MESSCSSKFDEEQVQDASSITPVTVLQAYGHTHGSASQYFLITTNRPAEFDEERAKDASSITHVTVLQMYGHTRQSILQYLFLLRQG